MSGSWRTGRAGAWLATLITVLAVGVLPSAARADEGDDNPPVISSVTATPASLPSSGGTIDVSAYVTDDIYLTDVFVEVHDSNGGWTSQYMSSDASGNYTATAEIAPNYTDAPVSYTIVVVARDNGNHETQATSADHPTVAADAKPTATDPSVSPRALPAAGGPVTIAVTATDDKQTSAYATVTRPDGTTTFVTLEAPSGSTRFTGTYSAPANTASTAAAYGLQVTAQDNVGHLTSVDGGTFTVAAKAAPPASTGRLAAYPSRLSFGSVAIGRSARQTAYVANVGPRNSAPIKATAVLSGAASFTIPGAGRSTTFTLSPGQAKVVSVQFAPSVLGNATGTLKIARADNGQAPLSVALSGTGTRRR